MATLDRLAREESWAPLSADLPVLASSNELVEALKSELRDCVGRVTRGRALLDLAAAFQVGGRVGGGVCEADAAPFRLVSLAAALCPPLNPGLAWPEPELLPTTCTWPAACVPSIRRAPGGPPAQARLRLADRRRHAGHHRLARQGASC